MKIKIVPILISMLVLFQTDVFPDDAVVPEAKHAFTPQTGISLGVCAFAVTTMFLVDKIRTGHQRGDSIISFFDSTYARSIELYNSGNYKPSNAGFAGLLSEYSTYSRYIKKRHRKLAIHYDTLNLYVEKSKLLGNLLPVIVDLMQRSDSLPDNDYDVLNADRRLLNEKKSYIQNRISMSVSENIHYGDVVRYGLRHSIQKLALLDSLIREVYQEQKNIFNVKCRYFYNRAIESGDTSRIRDFVDDCDYYQVDKEWCTRARLVINPPAVETVAVSVNPEKSGVVIKKMTQADSVNQDYQLVINSGRIDLLEDYVARYSKKKYTKYKAKLDSAKTVLSVLTKKLEEEKQYNKSHPLLANGDFGRIETFYRGISGDTEILFKNSLQSFEQEFRSIPGLRFPVSVSVDYTATPPILMLHAYIRCPEDIGIKKEDSLVTYSVQGINPAVKFLNGLKCKVAEEMKNSNSSESETINRAVYIVRLAKSAREYVTFYGKDKNGTTPAGSTDFYSFFDLTLKNYHDIRFDNSSVPDILVNRNGDDSLKRALSYEFFER